MERPLYPSKNMRITQGYNIGTHLDSYAIDEAEIDTGISKIHAPFTGIIKRIYPNDANEVWLESIEEVEYPDGTIDFMTILFAHANDVSNLFVGKRIEKGEAFYSEGTKGQVTGNHCHIECGKGKFIGNGWYKNSNGNFSINNGKKPEECLWIDDTINIINNNGYSFKKIVNEEIPKPTPTPEPEPTPTPEPKPTPTPEPAPTPQPSIKPKLIFTCPKTDLYGIYLKENQQLYIK